MALAFRIMLFVLIFNIAAGILNLSLEEYYPQPQGVPTGYQYSDSGNQLDNFKGSVSVPAANPDTTWYDKFLDFIRLGFFQKIQTFLDSTIYGIVGIFKNLGIIPDPGNAKISFYSYFYSLMTIVYVVGIIDLFTGKKVQY